MGRIYFMRYDFRFIFIILILIIYVINSLLYTIIFTTFDIISPDEIEQNLSTVDHEEGTVFCEKERTDNVFIEHYDVLKQRSSGSIIINVMNGGEWKPSNCTSQHLVAVIIPYRNRYDNLQVYLNYIHPFLQKQQIHYRIFVIEQTDKKKFNRGKLFNAGYLEALKLFNFSCLILHDVDLIPQSPSNIYACTKYPRHMTSSVDKDRYVLPYDTYFGGAVAILAIQFRNVNGFSNDFYGWGGEDDDFYNRVVKAGLKVCRFQSTVSRYIALSHKKEKPEEDRYKNIDDGYHRFSIDGINSIKYTVLQIVFEPLYTKIVVEV